MAVTGHADHEGSHRPNCGIASPMAFVAFLVAVTKSWLRQLKGGSVCFSYSRRLQSVMAGRRGSRNIHNHEAEVISAGGQLIFSFLFSIATLPTPINSI